MKRKLPYYNCFSWILVLLIATPLIAQDGTMYPMDAPEEPNAILLGTGGVENQPATESWFRQWGDPMARKHHHSYAHAVSAGSGESNRRSCHCCTRWWIHVVVHGK